MADTKLGETEDGPTSIRNQRLGEIFHRSLQASTKTLTFEKLAQCYPYVAQNGASGLREAMDQAMKFWEATSIKEFNAILQERDVARKLTELDKLIAEARERKSRSESGTLDGAERQIYVESLSPEDIINSHLTPINLDEADKLEKRIQECQAINKKLLREVASQEEDIDGLLSSINKSLDDLSAATNETSVLPERKEMFAKVDQIYGLIRR